MDFLLRLIKIEDFFQIRSFKKCRKKSLFTKNRLYLLKYQILHQKFKTKFDIKKNHLENLLCTHIKQKKPQKINKNLIIK